MAEPDNHIPTIEDEPGRQVGVSRDPVRQHDQAHAGRTVSPYYTDDTVTLHHGDCLNVLHELPDASVDAVVTDPPYDLTTGKRGGSGHASLNPDSPAGRSRIGTGNGSGGFMGKAWDATGVAFTPAVWAECLRVLKPGGHLLAFGGSRTWHRLTAAIEDAGFDIRDSIAWLYGSGFPKSLDVSKAIDKAAGAEREVVGRTVTPFKVDAAANRGTSLQGSVNGDFSRQTEGGYRYTEHTAPATSDAEQWQGWGTALKPAFEPIVMARKPLAGTVAANVLAHGTGALNIDACRVGDEAITAHGGGKNGSGRTYGMGAGIPAIDAGSNPHTGRWPANVVLDDTQAVELDRQSGNRPGFATQHDRTAAPGTPGDRTYGAGIGRLEPGVREGYNDSGGASRFFPVFRYEPKAPTAERPRVGGTAHPTVKPLGLMRWLVRLVTPPGGTVLDPFAGSGATAEACVIEGFQCIAIEREADYLPLIVARLSKPIQLGLNLGGTA